MGEIIVLEVKLRNQRVQNKIRRNIFIKVIIKKELHQLAIFDKIGKIPGIFGFMLSR
jgi:hypothetical protein